MVFLFSDSETADRWMMVGLLCEFWLPFFFPSFSYISPQANVSLTENTLSSTENDFFKWLRLPHSYECSAVKKYVPPS